MVGVTPSAGAHFAFLAALVAAGAITVGAGYAGVVEVGYINSVYCYNRMLTDAEILQNYNATKGRFGL